MGSRRGRTGYLIFANERRLEVLHQLKQEHGGSHRVVIAEVSKELGRLWNNLPAEQREHYKTQAATSTVFFHIFALLMLLLTGKRVRVDGEFIEEEPWIPGVDGQEDNDVV